MVFFGGVGAGRGGMGCAMCDVLGVGGISNSESAFEVSKYAFVLGTYSGLLARYF